MKKLFLILLIPFTVNATESFELPIVRVKDGDTIATTIKSMPNGLQDFSIRIKGIDTPEKGHRAKCPEEAVLAEKASAMTKEIAKGHKTMRVSNCEHDKYGGRIVCDVSIGGINVGKELIAAKLAYAYDGGKKASWCK